MKSLFAILASLALVGALFAGERVRYSERTRTKITTSSSCVGSSCTGKTTTTTCVGSTRISVKSSGCVGSSCAGSSSTRTSFRLRTR